MFKTLFLLAAIGLALAGPVRANDAQRSFAQLQASLTGKGAASLTGVDKIGDKFAPVIYFGRRRINGKHDIVDELRKANGAVATIFVRDGDEFMRVSTSVLTAEGKRDLATHLAHGKAYEALLAGKGHCGDEALQGTTYSLCYGAISDAEGRVIGAMAAGQRK